MFGFRKTRDIVTLFHKASSPASTRVVTLLKQASANAAQTATEDQASDNHGAPAPDFELDVTESLPTTDQLQTILEYVGQPGVGAIVAGASNKDEAQKVFRRNPDAFQRPVTVDWNNGRAVAGENESQILKLLSQLSK